MNQSNFTHEKQFQPPEINLPILKRLTITYKLWHEFLQHFPRTTRYTLGEKVDLLLLKIMVYIFTASRLKGKNKLPLIEKTSSHLDGIKFLIHITWELKAIDDKKYIRISEHLSDIGKMIGGWLKQIKSSA